MPSSVTSGFTADKALFPGHPSFRRMLTAPEGPLLPVLSMDMVLGGTATAPHGAPHCRGGQSRSTLLLEETTLHLLNYFFFQQPEHLSNSLSNCISGYWRCMHQGSNHIINIVICLGSRVIHAEVIAVLGVTVFKSLVLD